MGRRQTRHSAALVFFWGSETDSQCLVIAALSELNIHTWSDWYEKVSGKLQWGQLLQDVEGL